MLNKKKNGFTLAEVAIVLVVMSAVASILIPTLTASNERRVMITSLNKNYLNLLTLQDAINLENMRGRVSLDSATFVDTFCHQDDANPSNNGIFPKYLKTQKGNNTTYYKGSSNGQDKVAGKLNTYSAAVYTADGNTAITNFDNYIILRNGVIWVPYYIDSDKFGVFVDVNGIKSPNTVGRDIFYFEYKLSNGKWQVEPYSGGKCEASCEKHIDKPEINCNSCAYKVLEQNEVPSKTTSSTTKSSDTGYSNTRSSNTESSTTNITPDSVSSKNKKSSSHK